MSDSPTRRTRIALLLGGRSPEHDVSIISARSVQAALDPARFDVIPMAISRDGKWLPAHTSRALLQGGDEQGTLTAIGQGSGELVPDAGIGAAVDVVFPLLHGPFGEDGTIQGLLEILNVPYIGAGVAASAVGMDKALMKALFAQARLPVLEHITVRRHQWDTDRRTVLAEAESRIGFPCFVKPANMGSSIGISRCLGAGDLTPAIDLALRYDQKAIVERGVPGYREIECAVLGNDEPRVSVPGEILIDSTFYDYSTKYTEGAAGLKAPADIRPETTAHLQDLSLQAFRAIDAAGMARVDFFVSPDENEIWLNEINTIPGFTPFSMYPVLWQVSGLAYPDLIQRLVDLAIERHAGRASLQYERDDHEKA